MCCKTYVDLQILDNNAGLEEVFRSIQGQMCLTCCLAYGVLHSNTGRWRVDVSYTVSSNSKRSFVFSVFLLYKKLYKIK